MLRHSGEVCATGYQCCNIQIPMMSIESIFVAARAAADIYIVRCLSIDAKSIDVALDNARAAMINAIVARVAEVRVN